MDIYDVLVDGDNDGDKNDLNMKHLVESGLKGSCSGLATTVHLDQHE